MDRIYAKRKKNWYDKFIRVPTIASNIFLSDTGYRYFHCTRPVMQEYVVGTEDAV